jgi:hypothetical protein
VHLLCAGESVLNVRETMSKNDTLVFHNFSHYINIISIGPNLVCPIQFQPFLLLLDPPNAGFKSKLENWWWQSISLFQAILKRNLVRLIFGYTHWNAGFV